MSSFVHADFSTPAGIWDIQGIATVRGSFPGGKPRVARTSAYGFVQFKEGGAYTTIPWMNAPGKWQTLNNKRAYQVSFDLSAASSGQTRPPFLNAMLSQSLGLVKKQYRQVTAFKTLEIKSYADRGRLARNGMRITGTHKISATVTFVDPDTRRDVVGSVRMTLAYQGTRASAPSGCCSSDDAARNQADSMAFLAEWRSWPTMPRCRESQRPPAACSI